MDAVNWLEIVPSLALGIGLAACAGLRAWLPLLLLGGLARWGVVDLGPSFEFVASTRALILFGVATVIEIAGDKIPAVDHTLDALSTVLRPAAGSLLAASVLWQISDPLTAHGARHRGRRTLGARPARRQVDAARGVDHVHGRPREPGAEPRSRTRSRSCCSC